MKVRISKKLKTSKSFGISVLGGNTPVDKKNEEPKVEESEIEEPEVEEPSVNSEQKTESSVTKIKILL